MIAVEKRCNFELEVDTDGYHIEMHLQSRSRYCNKCKDWHKYHTTMYVYIYIYIHIEIPW